MRITLEHNGRSYAADLNKGHDLSIPLAAGPGHISAWYVNPITMEPVRMGDWTGAVAAGASVNFRNIFFNPHGHGTHTECLGHITSEVHSVNQYLKEFFFLARVITVKPEPAEDDLVITRMQLEGQFPGDAEAVIIRTLPNHAEKQQHQYSNTNPPYISREAALFLREQGVKHLLIDLPSVDREQDEGKLLAHHAFWNVPDAPRFDATITEMIYVDDSIADGLYLLNLQVAPFENDASPSRPVIFAVKPVH